MRAFLIYSSVTRDEDRHHVQERHNDTHQVLYMHCAGSQIRRTVVLFSSVGGCVAVDGWMDGGNPRTSIVVADHTTPQPSTNFSTDRHSILFLDRHSCCFHFTQVGVDAMLRIGTLMNVKRWIAVDVDVDVDAVLRRGKHDTRLPPLLSLLLLLIEFHSGTTTTTTNYHCCCG